MSDVVRVLAMSGSLRVGSYNTAALKVAIAHAPSTMTFEVAELRDIPPYDQDVYDAEHPAPVARLRKQCKEAHAILISSPEYNYSVPGFLKNALDWASRGPDAPLSGKTAAIFGATTGMIGTARGQYHMRQVLQALNMHVVTRPEVMIGQAKAKFDDKLNLIDKPTEELIQKLVLALYDLTIRMR